MTQLAIKVRGFRHVLVPTDKLAATSDFYLNLLGLKRDAIPPIRGYQFNLDWVSSGDVQLHIVERVADMKGHFNATLQPHIAFEITDASAAKESLTRAGHEIISASTPGRGVEGRAQLFVKDPSGLVVELYQEVSGSK